MGEWVCLLYTHTHTHTLTVRGGGSSKKECPYPNTRTRLLFFRVRIEDGQWGMFFSLSFIWPSLSPSLSLSLCSTVLKQLAMEGAFAFSLPPTPPQRTARERGKLSPTSSRFPHRVGGKEFKKNEQKYCPFETPFFCSGASFFSFLFFPVLKIGILSSLPPLLLQAESKPPQINVRSLFFYLRPTRQVMEWL